VLTGATNGIGEAAAIALAKQGAHLVLVGRDAARGEASLARVQAAGDTNATFLRADLSSMAEVRRLADQLRALPRIDVLVNNAGAVFMERLTTADGFERTLALNHLAYFLLTELLLDKIKASAPARIVNVASDAHQGGKLDFDDLQAEKHFSGFGAYANSKLCNILFTRELARRLQGTGVTANVLHPGTVATGFGRNNRGVFGVVIRMLGPFLRSPEKGAATIVYLAADPAVDGVSGQYFADCRPRTPARLAQDDADATKLWSVSEKLVAASG
jgi:retinol dehydrogenase-12